MGESRLILEDQHYKEIATIAQKRRADSLPKEYLLPGEALKTLPRNVTNIPRSSGHFTHEELEIIESDAEAILQKIKDKIWTSVEVTKAFSKAAVVAHQLTNCLTEILIPEALKRAEFLDEYLSKTGDIIGPLHGLPISLKDCFITPPHPSSIGMACYANVPTNAKDETVLVSLLAKLGAIFYVKTAVPVAMMMMETISNVWGETNGAYHIGTTSGGSSGGEGVLLAMRGSPLGIGTDIGGSIRIPSAFNGLFGLKPTVHPPIARGLALTKRALEAAGHEVFEWEPTNHPEMAKEMNNSFYTLGGAAILELTRKHDEPVFESMKNYEFAYDQGEHGTLGPTKLREMITRRNAYQKEYLDRWTSTGKDGKDVMDAIIMPASPWTAPRLGITQTDAFCVNFTGVWNLLDYPACTFPVMFADERVDKRRGEEWMPLCEKDGLLQGDYEERFYHGTPVALQCVGRRLEDEKVLEMVGVIGEVLRGVGCG
ncbi:hypothetical protein SS1G_02392 [Sclerotinia sclerotiorum 1980 UF-70]|uniref:amidase n=1 Tax=Sclerotinia sclerotiorum (strain ATCC 18683 / 1980 / Ss-1) TaxID=665079 RepID=A7EAR0_SCLS1|nr:hypothetical protein SS1G_02392 [Sclerotinia sclerotiorum 1980 UF-70]EDN99538.1 hypothetical protein SS1G_02392 [Sclerotinia sclerotiorum 1980 UF-70]